MTLSSLPMLMLEPVVRAALLEDLGRAGDLTTDAIVPAAMRAETALVARQPGIVAGLDAASLAFRLIDPAIEVRIERPAAVGGQRDVEVIVGVRSPSKAPLAAELRYAHRALHCPEVRIGEWNIDGVELNCVL